MGKDSYSKDKYYKDYECNDDTARNAIIKEIKRRNRQLSKHEHLQPLDNLEKKQYIGRNRINNYSAEAPIIDVSPPRNPNNPPEGQSQNPSPPGRLINIPLQIFSSGIREFRVRNCTRTIEYPCGASCSWRRGCRTKYCSEDFTYPCAIQRRRSQFTLYLVLTLPDPRSLPDRVQEEIENCYNSAAIEAGVVAGEVFFASSATVAGAILAALEAGFETFYNSFTDCLIDDLGPNVAQGIIDDFNITTDYKITPRSDWEDIRFFDVPGF
ncbi:hypothetical protein I0292_26820 (plasmid) [Priestia megaterium]|uniref:hypothetical protein n=1 Tax=Priestia megaterium TaxID=1404 RepID=UPI002068030B|nr:hypothetical protein [Priestia megaterium]UOO43972.1 hypothetical protein I0292_26820 [Priestia megaterium]